eukprot:gene7701-10473_t
MCVGFHLRVLRAGPKRARDVESGFEPNRAARLEENRLRV